MSSNFQSFGTYRRTLAPASTADLHSLLNPVDDAAHTRKGPVAVCLEGTRTDVIAEIMRCLEDEDRPICWVSGSAGSGKSALAQTIAKQYDAKGRLAASFFFLRGGGIRNTVSRAIPTLAYQISLSIPATEPYIRDVVRKDPGIFNQGLKHQFERLVSAPILAARATASEEPNPKVVVIDALDECVGGELVVEFVKAILGAFQGKLGLHLRVVLTSRVEEHIRRILERAEANSTISRLSIDNIDAHRDICKFLRTSFLDFCEENDRLMRGVSRPWPSPSDLDALAKKSNGLFIFATTLVKSICDGNDDPQQQLRKALAAHDGLDNLYTQVFSDALRDDRFEQVLGTIILLRDNLSVSALGNLLQLPAPKIVSILLGVQSVLMIPGEDNQPIRPFHASLRDFLTLKLRSGEFYINPPTRYLLIVTDCMAAMAMRPVNGIVYNEGQRYASMNWCYHFLQGFVEGGRNNLSSSAGTSLVRSLNHFIFQSYSFWINTLILEGWKNVIKDLDTMLTMLNVCDMFTHPVLDSLTAC
jgi:hypothetical protein